jgi:DNA mismatch endonuclease (patch repair protein)
MLFSGAKVAVFVDGCYWHGCPDHFRPVGRNREWWLRKIRANQDRDRDTRERLVAQGWLVLRFWEHDNVLIAADDVEAAVRGRTSVS